MQNEIKLPNLGEGIESGTIVQVSIEKGASINKGDTILEVETDKAVIPVPADVSGSITEIKVKENQEIKAGDVIAIIELVGDSNKDNTSSSTTSNKKSKEKEKLASQPASQVKTSTSSSATSSSRADGGSLNDFSNLPASPATRKLARELGIDLSQVTATGRGNRVRLADLTNHLKSHLQGGGGTSSNASPSRSLPDFTAFGEVEVKPISNLRKTIASQMDYCWTHIPHVHQFQEADINKITRLQKEHASIFKAKGSTLSVTPFLIKALAECLIDFPVFNASFDEQKSALVYKKYVNIGVAVDTPSGLIVPVLKNVDKMSIFEIGLKLIDLAKATRDRKVHPDDLKGASTTLSNLGGIGGTHFTPIINWPEVSILGVGRGNIKPKFVAADSNPNQAADLWKPITTLPIVLAYDHRVIDGAEAARFIMRFTQLIEDPDLLLMGMPQ